MVSTVAADGAEGKPLGGIPNGLLGPPNPDGMVKGEAPGAPPGKGDGALCSNEQ